MTLVRNNDTSTRRWDWLVDNGTGRTLNLRAGQTADVDLPDGFSDPYLAPAAPLDPPTPDTPPPPPDASETPTASPEDAPETPTPEAPQEGTDPPVADSSAPVEETS